jgi:hypothetical protein
MGQVTNMVPCTTCAGTGQVETACGACGGQGVSTEYGQVFHPCPACGGSGRQWGADGGRQCNVCGGTGGRQEQETRTRVCASCGGAGRKVSPCSGCSGSGMIARNEWVPDPPTLSIATTEQMRPHPIDDLRFDALQWQRQSGYYDSAEWMDDYLEEQRRRQEQHDELERYEEWEYRRRIDEALHLQHREHV